MLNRTTLRHTDYGTGDAVLIMTPPTDAPEIKDVIGGCGRIIETQDDNDRYDVRVINPDAGDWEGWWYSLDALQPLECPADHIGQGAR
jgi:hypothetical protein